MLANSFVTKRWGDHFVIKIEMDSEVDLFVTRMHSSRMCTIHCSACLGGVSSRKGVCSGGCPGSVLRGSAPPPVDKMTKTCENITFLQLLLRMVIKCQATLSHDISTLHLDE